MLIDTEKLKCARCTNEAVYVIKVSEQTLNHSFTKKITQTFCSRCYMDLEYLKIK